MIEVANARPHARLEPGSALPHRNDVDGLRAVAVLAVLFFHYHTGLFTGGFTGVDIFFVISGYVIGRSLIIDLKAGKFSIVGFYCKRIRRILPAFVATLVVTSIAACFVLLPSDLVDFGNSLAASGTFLSNFYFWRSSGYFATNAQLKPLLHTWSLSVEEQYYVFAPILFYVVYTYLKYRWKLVLFPILVASFVLSVLLVFIAPTANFFLFPTRMWELLLGAVIAFGEPYKPVSRFVREAVAAAGLALVMIGLIFLEEKDPFPGWNALFPCVGTALIIRMGYFSGEQDLRQPLVNRLLANSLFVAIGLISYSLYLVHWPIAAFFSYLALRTPAPSEAALMFGASIMLAWICWKYVEQPARHVDIKRFARPILLSGSAVVLASVCVGLGLRWTHGIPSRFPDYVERRIPGVEDWGGNICFNQDPTRAPEWTAEACTRIRGSGGRFLLWGDSYAAHYMPGVLRDAKRINADVLQYTFAGCPPIFDYYSLARVGCAPFNQNVPSLIKENKIDTVIMAGRWSDTPKATLAKLQTTVETLRGLGVRVFVLGQSPQFAADVRHIDYISKSYLRDRGYWAEIGAGRLNGELKHIVGDANFRNPEAYLCDKETCMYRDGQHFLYADAGHFSTEGSLRAVRSYFPAGQLR